MAGRFVGSRAVTIDQLRDQLDDARLAQVRQQEQLQNQNEQLQNLLDRAVLIDHLQDQLDESRLAQIRQQEELQNQKEQLQNLRDDIYVKLDDPFDKEVSRKPKMTSRAGTVNAMKATKAMKSEKAKKAMRAIQIT